MARQKGTLVLPNNIENNAAAPLDARALVKTKAELTQEGSFPYSYKGMIVSVQEENKVYLLTGTDTTDLDNWKELGSGEGLPTPEDKDKLLMSYETDEGELDWEQVDKDEVGSASWIGTSAEWEALPDIEKEKYDGKEVIITDDYEGDAEDTIELQTSTMTGTFQTTADVTNTFIVPFAYPHLYNFTVTQLVIRGGNGADDKQNWDMRVLPYVGYAFTRKSPIISSRGQYIISGTFTRK